MRSLREQTILVNGATDGLGRALAERLAAGGAAVRVHGRDSARAQQAVAEIRTATGNGAVNYVLADFSSLREVCDLARAILDGHDRLHGLANNAGIGANAPGDGRQESHDGHELRFAVNYLASFLLTHLLLARLAQSSPAPIVHVASAGQAPIDFDDVMLTRRYSGWQAYGQSKLAQVMFMLDLAEQQPAHQISTTALHPATCMPTESVDTPISSIEDGVQATFRLVADPALGGVTGATTTNGRRHGPSPRHTPRNPGPACAGSRKNSPSSPVEESTKENHVVRHGERPWRRF